MSILWSQRERERNQGVYFSVNENRFRMGKQKLRPILPTLKEKKRYLVFEVISDSKITDNRAISSKIEDNALEFLGQLGYGKAGVQVMDCWNPDKTRGIIKVNNNHVDDVKASLAFIKEIKNREVIVKSVGASGILDKAKEKYLS